VSKPEAAPYDDFVRCAALQEQRATMPPGRTHPLAHDAIIARGVKFALLAVHPLLIACPKCRVSHDGEIKLVTPLASLLIPLEFSRRALIACQRTRQTFCKRSRLSVQSSIWVLGPVSGN
jgi:hypothetical protein